MKMHKMESECIRGSTDPYFNHIINIAYGKEEKLRAFRKIRTSDDPMLCVHNPANLYFPCITSVTVSML